MLQGFNPLSPRIWIGSHRHQSNDARFRRTLCFPQIASIRFASLQCEWPARDPKTTTDNNQRKRIPEGSGEHPETKSASFFGGDMWLDSKGTGTNVLQNGSSSKQGHFLHSSCERHLWELGDRDNRCSSTEEESEEFSRISLENLVIPLS